MRLNNFQKDYKKNLGKFSTMGQSESTETVQENGKTAKSMQDFNTLSKSGVGVHMFSFTPPAAGETMYIGSEVTDENDILDVKYTQWKKTYLAADDQPSTNQFFKRPESKLKVIWKPVYNFTSGRTAMVMVKSLLDKGYKMQVCEPEQE